MCERVSYSVIYLLYHRLHDNDRDDGVNFLSLSVSVFQENQQSSDRKSRAFSYGQLVMVPHAAISIAVNTVLVDWTH